MDDADEAFRSREDWFRNPETRRRAAEAKTIADRLLKDLLAKASLSTDPEIRGASAAYAGAVGAYTVLGGAR